MRSKQTPWTKTGKTARTVTAQTDGPSRMKSDLTVPEGTAVRFIGRWVVADLTWLMEYIGTDLAAHLGYPKAEIPRLGRGSITYHDADHYGITIDPADVTDIKEV